MTSKHLIIVSGSCSRKSNWFDQIDFFEKQGYQISFIEVEAYKFTRIGECADNLFAKLILLLNEKPAVILAHSMGGMLLLKILSETEFYGNKNSQGFANIENSKIFFIQVPLNVHHLVLDTLKLIKYFLYPLQKIYRAIFSDWTEKLLLGLKRFSAGLPFGGVFLSFILNQILILNGVLSTNPKEFNHLIEYYHQWDEFLLEKFPSKTMPQYFFTVGQPDFFCEDKLTREFAERIGANVLELRYGFHVPQHMFWIQRSLHQKILEEILPTSP